MLGLIFSMKENALCAQSDSGNTHTSHNHWKIVAAAAAARNADCVWLTGSQSNQKHNHHKYCLLTGSAYLNIPPSRSRSCVCLSPPVPMQNIKTKSTFCAYADSSASSEVAGKKKINYNSNICTSVTTPAPFFNSWSNFLLLLLFGLCLFLSSSYAHVDFIQIRRRNERTKLALLHSYCMRRVYGQHHWFWHYRYLATFIQFL